MPKLTNNHVQSFEIRHLLYGDAIFNEANNKMFHWRFESIKWISFLASGIVRETKKNYQQFSIEYLQRRSWFAKLLKDFERTWLSFQFSTNRKFVLNYQKYSISYSV